MASSGDVVSFDSLRPGRDRRSHPRPGQSEARFHATHAASSSQGAFMLYPIVLQYHVMLYYIVLYNTVIYIYIHIQVCIYIYIYM